MPKRFFKRACTECRTPALVPKKAWKLMKRRKQTPVCTSCLFKSGIYFPYIPLQVPVRI